MKPIVIHAQKGAALIVGLIVLLVMTLIGVSSLNMTTTELKMSGNLQAYDVSFQAADAIIRQTLWVREGEIDWTATTLVETYAALDGSSEAEATLQYIDCRTNLKGFSLTSESSFVGMVHSLSAEGSALNSLGVTIASSSQEIGIQTVRPGCPQI